MLWLVVGDTGIEPVTPELCEGFPARVGCAGYREIPLMLGAAGDCWVGCGRFGATVVLHAQDHLPRFQVSGRACFVRRRAGDGLPSVVGLLSAVGFDRVRRGAGVVACLEIEVDGTGDGKSWRGLSRANRL